jgi:hypothetical protein
VPELTKIPLTEAYLEIGAAEGLEPRPGTTIGGSVQRHMDAQLIELNKKSRNIERLCKDPNSLVVREDLFERIFVIPSSQDYCHIRVTFTPSPSELVAGLVWQSDINDCYIDDQILGALKYCFGIWKRSNAKSNFAEALAQKQTDDFFVFDDNDCRRSNRHVLFSTCSPVLSRSICVL